MSDTRPDTTGLREAVEQLEYAGRQFARIMDDDRVRHVGSDPVFLAAHNAQNALSRARVLLSAHPDPTPEPDAEHPSPSVLYPHGPIVGHPKHDYYICGDCHQPLGPGPCPTKMPTQPNPPTFNSLLSDPTQQLDPEGIVLKSITPEPDTEGSNADRSSSGEPDGGDVGVRVLDSIYRAAVECVTGRCEHEYDHECASDWLANQRLAAREQGRAEGEAAGIREAADEMWRIFLRLPHTPSPLGDYIQRRVIELRARADRDTDGGA